MQSEFSCSKCGACCRAAPDSFLEAHGLPRASKGGCGNLLPDNTCAIYETRPLLCRVKEGYMLFGRNMTWAEYVEKNTSICDDLQKAETSKFDNHIATDV